ncbi:MAG: NADH-quinone oxidoreductase subunit N, partial [Rhizobiaceae bacterium]
MELFADIPNLALAMPEMVMAVGAMVLLMIGVYSDEEGSARSMHGLSILLLVIAGVCLVIYGDDGAVFNDAFLSDSFARLMKLLVLTGSAVAIMMSYGFARHASYGRFEYPILIVMATLGMMLMISAND